MDKQAVVLGCSTGVGSAIAKALAKSGRDIIGFHRGRHNEDARELARYIHFETGADLTLRTLDVGSSPDAVADGCAVVMDQANCVDVVVHSLSGASLGPAIELNHTQIERTFWNLAHSFLWWARTLVNTDRLAPGCRFLALTNPCTGYYLRDSGVIGAAKSALESYVRTLACELGPKGYRVNGLSFGAVATPSLKKVMPEAVDRWETLHRSLVPAGAMQTCEDIAELVVQLVDKPTTINGAIIDGTACSTVKLMDYAFYGPSGRTAE
jgi:NAD(P)-dependent dehydrogenase (short-subunit alcohol dehydrogenase family)